MAIGCDRMVDVVFNLTIMINGQEFWLERHWYEYEYPMQNHYVRAFFVRVKRAKFRYLGLKYYPKQDMYVVKFRLDVLI